VTSQRTSALTEGLGYMHGRLRFSGNPRQLPVEKQPDAELKHYIENVRMVGGRPSVRGATVASEWLPVSNFSTAYGLRLRRALEEGRGDTVLSTGTVTYVQRPAAYQVRSLRARVAALDALREQLDVLMLGKELRNKLLHHPRASVFRPASKTLDTDINSAGVRRERAARRLRRLTAAPALHRLPLRDAIGRVLDEPTWAGELAPIVASARRLPLYLLEQYVLETYEQRAALLRGSPKVAEPLWALYHERCVEGSPVCRPDVGHFELQYAEAARSELEAFQRRALASLPLTPAVRRQLLRRWARHLSTSVYRTAEEHITRLHPNASGMTVHSTVSKICAGTSNAAAAELLRARLLGELFRAADDGQVAYVASRPLKKTIRTSQAAEMVRANLRRLGLPLRRPDQPVSVGWSVEISPLASAQVVVRPEQRRILLLAVPGDPPAYSAQDLYVDFGLHELAHILRGESGRRGPFALLATGVRGYIDYEEGLAALLERLAVVERRTERRTTHALGYYAAHLALQNAAPRYVRCRYSWQEIYDLCSQYGVSRNDLYETIRRLVRMTDGRRRPRNLNLRDAVYFRGIKELESWLAREFRQRLVRSSTRGTIPRLKHMPADLRRRERLAAQVVLDTLNELMVGKVTPSFSATLQRHGHSRPPAFLLTIGSVAEHPPHRGRH